MGNSANSRFCGRLRAWAHDADEGLRAAASWALGKLKIAEDQRES
jgi:hypothetical protein